jgi:hypothetical protein
MMESLNHANAPDEFLSIKRMPGLWPAGAPLVLMAAGKIGPNAWWGEYGIFIPGTLGLASKAHVDLNAGVVSTAYPNEIDMIDAGYMRIELEQRVISCLSMHFSEIAIETGRQDLFPNLRYELQDAAKKHIFDLIRNGAFLDEVRSLSQRTRHGVLRGYLSAIIDLVATLSKSGCTPVA